MSTCLNKRLLLPLAAAGLLALGCTRLTQPDPDRCLSVAGQDSTWHCDDQQGATRLSAASAAGR